MSTCPITGRTGRAGPARRRPSGPFLRPRPVADPAVRVVAFHHAGGSALTYAPLARVLPPDWDLLVLDLPGRGLRRDAAPLRTVAEVVATAVADLQGLPGDVAGGTAGDVTGDGAAPLALFGHSMGAIVAAETARALPVAPVWVGVSGRLPPSVQAVRPNLLHDLSDEDLLDALIEMGGTPEALREHEVLRVPFLRTIRADLAAVVDYRPAPDRRPLPCPLSTFAGRDDHWAPPAAMAAWARETAAGVVHHAWAGGHFYFLPDTLAAVGAALVHDVRAALPGTARVAA